MFTNRKKKTGVYPKVNMKLSSSMDEGVEVNIKSEVMKIVLKAVATLLIFVKLRIEVKLKISTHMQKTENRGRYTFF